MPHSPSDPHQPAQGVISASTRSAVPGQRQFPYNPCVLMLLETAFPPDSRVKREARALVEAGYDVVLCCSKAHAKQADQEIIEGIQVLRFNPATAPITLTLLGGKLKVKTPASGLLGLAKTLHKWGNKLHRQHFGIEQAWAEKIAGLIKQLQPAVVHVHDLKLLPATLTVLANHPTIKVVSDLHENYPALLAFLTEQRKGKQAAEKKRAYWHSHEANYLPLVNHVITVAPEAKTRLANTIEGLHPERITVLENVMDMAHPPNHIADPATRQRYDYLKDILQNRFVVGYIGYINNRHRGLHTVIEAMGLIKAQLAPKPFTMALLAAGGQRPAYVNDVLKPLIEQYNLQSDVLFTDFLDAEAFGPFIQLADVCVCPHIKTELTDTTFPNKVYLYGYYQKPLLASDCAPLKRYVEETHAGLCFASEDPKDCAVQLLKLYTDEALRFSMAQDGHQAVTAQYNWGQEKIKLLSLYSELCPQTPRPSRSTSQPAEAPTTGQTRQPVKPV
ncbi:MAG: glycosyltransferase [Cyanobacteria bacterium HKST-UBA03]|nr:glycosyltransferase [Cyanobacteria bacterium HKST-UBA03]